MASMRLQSYRENVMPSSFMQKSHTAHGEYQNPSFGQSLICPTQTGADYIDIVADIGLRNCLDD
jgi:hypothetical protein